MKFFKNLFPKEEPKVQVTCPRCLGKGHVEEEDIKRLKRELYWEIGDCAYCLGTGEVDFDMESKVLADEFYLSLDISKRERKRLIANHKGAKFRAEAHKREMDKFIERIVQLYVEDKMNVENIVSFFIPKYLSFFYGKKHKEELVLYINKIIKVRKL